MVSVAGRIDGWWWKEVSNCPTALRPLGLRGLEVISADQQARSLQNRCLPLLRIPVADAIETRSSLALKCQSQYSSCVASTRVA